ncbi:39S ribosomal protein L42, mitochondrial-like [Gigantopelta aegis]|uniref:39S ribosomal protein L42, mitochondrial-like n=1 Tax=Gigantopelta aegis TaxID=1735272 RepID=UPI001B88CC23|nr:39S ribosomal protein L42, mitochondrial-like [Gigantopelta aegis]
MAAPMVSLGRLILSNFVKICTNTHGSSCCRIVRQASSYRVPQVGLSPDGSTVVCWHPEPDFPYEHTQPLPRNQREMAEGDSVLKVQYLVEEQIKYRSSGPTDKELSNMFFTTKHRWYPKPEKKYKKLTPPKDRDHI